MGKFETFRDLMVKHFTDDIGDSLLFTVDIDKDELWNLYLDSFPEGTNPVYRTRREYDCSCCRSFMREIGGVVWIDDNFNKHSIFAFDTQSEIFQPVVDALAVYVESKQITGLYLYNDRDNRKTVGVVSSLEKNDETGGVTRWKHYYLPLNPRQIFVRGPRRWGVSETIGSVISNYNSSHDVFKRSLEEISEDAVDTLLELNASNSLYRGQEWQHALNAFKLNKLALNVLDQDQKENYYWYMCGQYGAEITHIRNHSIGVLLQDLSASVDLETAVRKYESIVAPANYKRPKPLFTKKMLENAQKMVEELGLMNSLPRRFAMMDDIPVQHVLFSNKDSDKKANGGNPFAEMADDITMKPFQVKAMVDKVRPVPVDKFITDVLPLANEVEVLMERRLEKNLCSLIAPVDANVPSLFKWNNGYSWAYNGNLASSDIQRNVQDAGGSIDGVLRFSIQWNEDGKDNNDLDAHCEIRDGYRRHIFFQMKHDDTTEGQLDVDIIEPLRDRPGKPAVENIVFPDKEWLVPGNYLFYVNCYTNRGGRGGFKAEIEFDGTVYRYEYGKEIWNRENVIVAKVTVDEEKNIQIAHNINPTSDSKKVWGISENRFIPVTVIAESPNYWGENSVGARHLMFMLKGCQNPDTPNGFFNEYIRNDLMVHKKVFEALGNKMKVAPSENQLSGLGFNLTERNELVIRVKGAATQIVKVMF